MGLPWVAEGVDLLIGQNLSVFWAAASGQALSRVLAVGPAGLSACMYPRDLTCLCWALLSPHISKGLSEV